MKDTDPPPFSGMMGALTGSRPAVIDAKAILDRVEAVGTVAGSAAQLFALVGSRTATLADFERVVRPDVALTANLLRAANSAFYRGMQEVSSVKEAINRMGLKRVVEVAAGASFAKAMPRTLPGYDLDADQLWSHSIATAVLSDQLGREAGFTYPDLAFTAGLLHELGKLALGSFLASSPAGSIVKMRAEGRTLVDVERNVLGTDHTEVGEAIAQKWGLPKEIAGAARWHHAPGQAPTATLRFLAAVVHLADAAAHRTGHDTGELEAPESEEALERIGISPERLMSLVQGAKPEITRTIGMLTATRG